MLIKFFARGTGSGRGPVEYVTKGEGREAAPPTVLRGTPERTRELIDGIERQWRYTSGVISFAAEDAPSAADQRQVMDEFERTAFAGLEADQYDILWVRHQHTEGSRVELHFVVPRVELSTGKALNIAPPGWQRLYDPLRDALNWEKGWARPDDPERAREAQPLRERPERLADREAITGYLSERIVAGDVQDRAGIVRALEEAGLEVTRQGREYVSVKDRETGEKWRLKGAIYAEGWSRDPAGGSPALADAERAARDRERRARRAQQARELLASRVRDRTAFHEKQFGGRDGGADHGPERRDAADRGQAEALASLDRLGVQRDHRDGLGLALERDGLAQGRPGEPARRERPGDGSPGAAEGEHAWAGPSEREGRHVPDPAGRLYGQAPDALDLRRAGLPETGLSHEPTDTPRARASAFAQSCLRRVSEGHQRLAGAVAAGREHFRAAAGADRPAGAAAVDVRGFYQGLVRSTRQSLRTLGSHFETLNRVWETRQRQAERRALFGRVVETLRQAQAWQQEGAERKALEQAKAALHGYREWQAKGGTPAEFTLRESRERTQQVAQFEALPKAIEVLEIRQEAERQAEQARQAQRQHQRQKDRGGYSR